MTAGDGPHYTNNVALMGDGDYKLTFLSRHRKPASFVIR